MANEEEITTQPLTPNLMQNTIPVEQSYLGGMPPLKGARRPSGIVKLDQFGNEIGSPFEKETAEKDITKMPEFIEAFGGDTSAAIKRSASNKKIDNNSVTIIHGKGKPMTFTGNADPRELNK